jgi:hypothetical protein
MVDPSDAEARTPRQPSPVRQDGAFQAGNAPYRYRAERTTAGEELGQGPSSIRLKNLATGDSDD